MTFIVVLGMAVLGMAAPALAADPPAPIRRSRVMEFDARLIQGQSPRAGAVYLFHRSPRRLSELVKLRPRYLRKIVVPVLGPAAWRRGGE